MAKLNITTLAKQFDITVTDSQTCLGVILDVIGDMSNVPVTDKIKIQDLGEIVRLATERGARDIKRDKTGPLLSLRIITSEAVIEFCYIFNKCFRINVYTHDCGPKWNFTYNSKNFHLLYNAVTTKSVRPKAYDPIEAAEAKKQREGILSGPTQHGPQPTNMS